MGYQSGFSHEKVWVLGMGDVCMMVPIYLQMELVEPKIYGVLGVIG